MEGLTDQLRAYMGFKLPLPAPTNLKMTFTPIAPRRTFTFLGITDADASKIDPKFRSQ
jgi:hypothetical protein